MPSRILEMMVSNSLLRWSNSSLKPQLFLLVVNPSQKGGNLFIGWIFQRCIQVQLVEGLGQAFGRVFGGQNR